MSYARKGLDSDLYLYRSVAGFECNACILGPVISGRIMDTLASMAQHVVFHANAGHKIPMYTLDRILRELREAAYMKTRVEESFVECDVCGIIAEPGGILSHCIDCGNCLDHCGCSEPDWDAKAKDDLLDYEPERYS